MDIGVYGLGRFGSFWAQLLAQKFNVYCYSRSEERLTPPGTHRVKNLRALMESDTIFLCTAISSLPLVLKEISPWVRPGSLIMDTCSVKTLPCHWMKEILPPETQILATHPMFGPDSGKNGVQGLPIVVHNLQKAEAELVYWKSAFSSFGMNVLEMTPEEHDKGAAYTQGLTHLVGRVLADMKVSPNPIATKGFKSLLEIVGQTCNDPWQLFLDLQTFNPYTSEMRKDFLESFSKIQDALTQSLDTTINQE